MILVDTSVWADHLRAGEPELVDLLGAREVLAHPWVIGELALGNLGQRDAILAGLRDLPQTAVASDDEVLAFIERNRLAGLGIGYVDVHLLASARLNAVPLWTRDMRLKAVAEGMGLVSQP
jgi:predicted nucleic acid-binding protein